MPELGLRLTGVDYLSPLVYCTQYGSAAQLVSTCITSHIKQYLSLTLAIKQYVSASGCVASLVALS